MYCDSTPENPANSNHQCVSSSTPFPIICSQDVQNALWIFSKSPPHLTHICSFYSFFFYDPTAAHNHCIWVHGHSTKFPFPPPPVERRMQVGAFHFEPPSMVRSLERAGCFLPCQYRWYPSQST